MSGISTRVKTGALVTLILCNFAAVVLFSSWYRTQVKVITVEGKQSLQYAETTPGSIWKQLDYAIFKKLNGSLIDRKSAQTFWSLANNRAFDLISAGLMGMVLWFAVLRKGSPAEKLEQIKVGVFLLLVTLVVVQLLRVTLFDFSRPSASLVIEDGIIRLSQLDHVTWRLKDSSLSSFPGDHGSVLLVGTVYITRFSNFRWGLVALLVAILCTLPRVVAGAHWATDVLVGSTFVTLVSASWALCLSRWNIGPGLFHRPALYLMKIARLPLPSPEQPPRDFHETSERSPITPTMNEDPVRPARSFKDYLYLVFTGICMGAADIVPGVSGGTMAFIMGIYEELLNAIKSFNIRLLRLALKFRIRECFSHVPWQFLLVLGSSILITLKLLAGVVHGVLGDPVGKAFLYAFFFGLVLASIFTLSRQIKWKASAIIAFLIGTVVASFIVGLVPAAVPHTSVFIFFSGMIAIMAMILPGISGSFILLILGQYAFVVGALKDLDFKVIFTFAAGAALGLLGFARILSWLLKRFHVVTVAALIGFMAGSLRKIWPFKDAGATTFVEDRHGDMIPIVEPNRLPDFSGSEWWISLALALLGIIVILIIDAINLRLRKEKELI